MTNLARKPLLHLFIFAACLLAFAGQAHAQGGMTLNSSYACNAGAGCSGNVNIITDVAVRLNANNTATIGGCYNASYLGSTGGGFNGTYIVQDGNNFLFSASFSNSSPPQSGNLNFSQKTFSIPAGVNPLNLRMRVFFTHSINGSQSYQFDTLADGSQGGGGGSTCNSAGSCNYQWRRYTAGNFPGGCNGSGVGPDPVCQTITGFTASPSTINAGDSTTLSWTTSNATSVDIVDLATGATIASGLPANGSLAVSPSSSRSYRVLAYGSCAVVSADVGVSVNACQSIGSFSASATTINAGESTTLSYSLSNASSATITDLTSGQVFNVPVQSGSLVVSPPSTRTYRLSAEGACGTVTQDIGIAVNQPPTIGVFWVNPNPICAGSTTTLGWDTSGASAVSITDLSTGAVTGGLGTSGTLDVAPPSSRTYRLTASNGAGSVTQDVSITVNPLAAINGFSASASTINAGQSTNLNFSVSNTSARSITDLATGVVTNLVVEGGAITVTPPSTRTYRLAASNGCNTVTQDVLVTVIQPPVISTFTSNVGSVCSGGAATLSWSASGGTSATVSAPGLPGSPVAVNPTSGSLGVNPTSTTTYTLTVANSAGSVTQTVTVSINPAPSVGSFGASATTINAGQSTTLSFSSSNGSSASITDLTTGGVTAVPVSGSLVVTPPTSRTYRFTVSGTCGTVTQDLAITVIQPPTISSFTASATTICAGSSATLSWASSGATSASITDLTSGAVTPVAVNGTLAVAPPSSRTYRLTVTNSAGSVTRDLAITVTPLAVINTFSASATTINVGQSTTLTFNVSNTSSRTITDLTTGTVTTLGVESGTQSFTPATTRTYRLSAVSGCNTVTQDVTITVTQPPTISTFTSSASPVCAGGASTLSWTASGGTSATISAPGLPGSPVAVNPASGSLVVNPSSTTTYTLTVANSAGSVTRTVTVAVTPAPAIATYSASATTINAGQSTTLSWTSTDGTSASITDLSTSTVTSVPVSGSLAVTPPTTRAYRLTINGSCGTVTQDVTITVNQTPTISTFAASASPVCSGAASTLSWTASGGTSATISAAGLPGSPVAVNPNSGTLVVNPTSTTTYTLTVTNAVGSTTRTVTVTVTPAPTIGSFTATPSTVVQGSSSTLAWTSSNGSTATITDLTTNVVTNVGVNSSLVVTPPSTRQYRLTVNGSCGTVTQTLTVTVTPCQTISSFTASATTINAGQSTTLSYTLTGATSASITDLATGTVTNVPVQSGTLVVTPPTSRSYRLSAAGPCATLTQDIAITVNQPPTISSFAASASPICVGSSSTLSWSASGGTSATISAPGLPGSPVTVNATSGTLSVTPSSTTTYTLTVTNAVGSTTQTVTVSTTTPAVINGFQTSDNPVFVGQQYTFSWLTQNAATVQLFAPNGLRFTAPDQPSRDNGSFLNTAGPPAPRTVTWQLQATNVCGTVSRSITFDYAACPTASGSTFSASSTNITGGTPVTLSWSVPNATTISIDQGVGAVAAPSGTKTVNPPVGTTTYTLTADSPGDCLPFTMQVTITATAPPGVPLVGPQGQPAAVGPTDNNDDYTNMTAKSGVAVAFGGTTTAGGVITFTNTALNNSTSAENMAFTARSIPTGFIVDASVDGGTTWTSLNTGAVTGVAGAGATYTLLVRVTYPAGLNVLTAYPVVLRLANVNNPAAFNETIDRLWTGFVRADKSYTVTNSTGVGAAGAAVPGAVIQYSVAYSNVTTSGGTGNVNLTATNVSMTEDGNAPPNNWGTTTTHVAGSASDTTTGSSITGDTAGSNVLTLTIPSLGPGASGTFKFSRKIK